MRCDLRGQEGRELFEGKGANTFVEPTLTLDIRPQSGPVMVILDFTTHLGRRVTPHQFRHAAATTIATSGEGDARMIRPLLGHAASRIAEEFYIVSGQIEASRQYQELLNKRAILLASAVREGDL